MKVQPLVALAVAVLCALAGSQTLPVITKHPTGGVYSMEHPITLTCETNSSVNAIEWHREDGFVGSGAEYRIASFSEEDEGTYRCCATINGVGTVTSAVATLQLAVFAASPPGDVNSAVIKNVPMNEPAVLNCGSIQSVPPTTYDWEFSDGFPISPTDDNAIIGIDGLLYLQLVEISLQFIELSHAFVCTANNRYTQGSQSGYIQVSVDGSDSSAPAAPRQMLAVPQNVTASIGDSVSFQCIVGGSPVPDQSEITWSSPVPGNQRPTQNNAILTVRAITTEDEGTYSCHVEGLQNYSAVLTVHVPPVLSTSLAQTQTVIYGDPLSLTCSVTNTPVTTWQWYHNGNPLPTPADETHFKVETTNTTHEGIYQCFAYNLAGNVSSTIHISVMTIPANITVRPVPASSLVFVGSNITYTCSARGAPPPTIIWLHNGLPIRVTATNLESRETTSSLVLSDMVKSNSGVYTCRAANEVEGTAVGSQEVEANVAVIAPTIITTPNPLEPLFALNLDQPATLPCIASSEVGVTLHFTWEKDASSLTYDKRISLSVGNNSSNITFTTVTEEDSGFYICRVVTGYNGVEGPLVTSISINVTAAPEMLIAPVLHTIDEVNATSFKIYWYFPGINAQDLFSYTIMYRELEHPSTSIEHTQLTNLRTTYTVSASAATPVKPYTVYVVRVWANYKNGESVGSDNVTVMTSEDVPGAPEEVTGTVTNTTSVLVEWKHPQEPNGIITNYTLRYKLEKEISYTLIEMASNDTEYELFPLLPKASYEIQVAGSTSVGLGPYSDAITIFTDTIDPTPIYSRIWFIVIISILSGVLIVVCVLLCVIRYARKNHRKYNVRTPVHVELTGRSARSMTDEEMADYNGRGSRRIGDLNSVVLGLEGHETDSSVGDRYPYEPSISTTVSRMSSQAPAYINPPPFEEAVKHSRMAPAYSGSTIDRQPPSSYGDSDWGMDSNSKTRILREMIDNTPSPLNYTPPPPPPLSPSPTTHLYASLKGLNSRGQGEKTPQNGYNHLSMKANPHLQGPLSTSQPTLATFV